VSKKPFLHCAVASDAPQQFPHPLANIKSSNVDANYTNFMSYPLVELMTWQGLGDLVNRFRVKTLGLEPMSTLWAPGQLFRLKVPYTYLWSPGLVPRPPDWGPEIDIAGFVFLDLASGYNPPEELVQFLDAGEEPIYIGFGSISGVEDPDAFTKMVFGAVEMAGVRALISKGWGDMGKGMDIPDNILLLDNVPHDWLFPKVRAVVHHGGAGTTAAGLKCGKPTMIVPFFGDQPFWGAMVATAGAGARQCLPLKKLTVDKFAEGIKQCLTEEARQKAEEIAKSIEKEGDGAENAVNSFHRALPLDGDHSLRCFVFEERIAVWRYRKTYVHLSALAADLLVEAGRIQWRDLRLLRHYDWNDFQGPGEPFTGAGGAMVSGVGEVIHGLSSIRGRAKKGLKYREKQKRRKKRRTVANAIAIPGQVAHQRLNLSAPLADRMENRMKNLEEVNLHGDAAPPSRRLQSIAPTSTTPAPEHLGMNGDISSFAYSNTGEVPDPPSVPMTILKATAQGFGHSGKALLQMPVDFWYALALGFHNAPRLYGDGTVRPPPRTITGFRSGMKAAGTGFAYGFSDGITGLVRLPRHDIEEDGASGLLTGVGKGIGGLVLKPISGVVGLGGYTAKGLETGIRKRVRDTGKTDRWIRRGRINQAEKDIRKLRDKKSSQGNGKESAALEEARAQVLRAWATHERYQEHMAAKEKEQKKSCRGETAVHKRREKGEKLAVNGGDTS
jgi:UDP:flavonoid glycosyltransferase YjiC (YdhE family)